MALVTSNLDKHWERQSEAVKIIFSEFNKPLFENIFERNKDYLRYNADTVPFKYERWTFNPLLFCQEYYGEQYYYLILNLVNGIGTVFEFYADKLNNQIIAPKDSHISSIIYRAKMSGIKIR